MEEEDSHDFYNHGDDADEEENEEPEEEEQTDKSSDDELHRAGWMSGNWGIGFRIPGGRHYNIFGVPNQAYYIDNFNINGFVQQVQSIAEAGGDNPKNRLSHVIIGITSGANGMEYITWHSVLNKIAPLAAPLAPPEGRDLFGEIAKALRDVGIKTIAYVATEGPARLRHGARRAFDWNGHSSPSVDAWYKFVEETYGNTNLETMKLAFAEVIISEFAERYGDLIAGWWFDHAAFGDKQALKRVIHEANPDAALAFNQGPKVPLRNNFPGLEDYTAGHPNPVARNPPSSAINLPMVESIEKSDGGYLVRDGFGSLGHMFMPVGSTWNALRSREPVWTVEQASDWMRQALGAGGTWTWNVPREGNRPTNLWKMKPQMVTFLHEVNGAIESSEKKEESKETAEELAVE